MRGHIYGRFSESSDFLSSDLGLYYVYIPNIFIFLVWVWVSTQVGFG